MVENFLMYMLYELTWSRKKENLKIEQYSKFNLCDAMCFCIVILL